MLKSDWLHSNNITEIEIEENGDVWIGTRVAERDNSDPTMRTGKGGINRWSAGMMIFFPEIPGFNDDDVYGIYNG